MAAKDAANSGSEEVMAGFEEEYYEEHGYMADWSPLRKHLAVCFNSLFTELVLFSVVVFNMVVIVAETVLGAKNQEATWVNVANNCFLALYTAELCIRVYTFRRKFFSAGWQNLLDFVLVSIDWMSIPISVIFGDMVPVSFFRIFRLSRLARSASVTKFSPELSVILKGFWGSAKTLFWGAIMILLMLTGWSILAVEFIHPINLEVVNNRPDYDGCVRCARAYESVFQSNLSLFQSLVAGDSWGAVTIPVIEHRPVTALYFVGVHLTVSIGLMNLLLAVIVDQASQARLDDVATLVKEEQAEGEKLKSKLVAVCTEMDEDKSGLIGLEELQLGYNKNHDFRLIMKQMDIEEEDMKSLFKMMDEDKSGTVPYAEFADHLWKMKSTDDHTLLLFLKFGISEINQTIQNRMKAVDDMLGSLTTSYVFSEQFGASHKELVNSVGEDQTKESKQILLERDVAVPDKLIQSTSASITDEIVALRHVTEDMAKTMKQTLASTLSVWPPATPQMADPQPPAKAAEFGSCCNVQSAAKQSPIPRAPPVGQKPTEGFAVRDGLPGPPVNNFNQIR
jgi:voltage-gated sodium channel